MYISRAKALVPPTPQGGWGGWPGWELLHMLMPASAWCILLRCWVHSSGWTLEPRSQRSYITQRRIFARTTQRKLNRIRSKFKSSEANLNHQKKIDHNRNKGRKEGSKEGEGERKEGKKEGRKEAREEGRKQASKEGRKEARKEGTYKNARFQLQNVVNTMRTARFQPQMAANTM